MSGAKLSLVESKKCLVFKSDLNLNLTVWWSEKYTLTVWIASMEIFCNICLLM